MAQTFNFRDPIPFPAAKTLDKMLDAKFLAEWTKVQKGLNPQVKMVEQTAEKAHITIDLEEPLPAPLGTVKAHMTFVWNIKTRVMEWKRVAEGSMASKANIHGVTKVVEKGPDACELWEDIVIDIPIPLVGKKFEGLVGDYLRGGRPSKIAFLISSLKG